MKYLIPMLCVLPFVAACAGGPSKSELDEEVRRLCAIDGGVKVYETVKLPADKFNQWGQVNFYKPTQGENALGSDYIYKWDIHYYKKGEPTLNGAQETAMRRDAIKITRKSDMKVLGEFVTYHRAGGDLPGPWMPSSYRCPDIQQANEVVLMGRVFTKTNEGEGK
jgi:hypothetical protein